MAMPVTLRRYTIDDLDRFPDDGNRYELLDGVLFVTPAPLPPHEAILHRLLLAIGNHIVPWRSARASSRVGRTLSRRAGRLVAPQEDLP
jgi:Uma2 family endonuclease